jgi:hypothetical protein
MSGSGSGGSKRIMLTTGYMMMLKRKGALKGNGTRLKSIAHITVGLHCHI